MHTFKRFDRAAFGLLGVFLGALFLYLFGYSLLYSCAIDTAFIAAERVVFFSDPLLPNLLRVITGLALCFMVIRLDDRLALKPLTCICLALTFALGCAWVVLLRAQPINDTGILHYTAAEMARGNPIELWRHEVYLRTNPHQAGFLQYSEIMQRIFGRHSIIPQGILNALYLTGAYAALFSLTWQTFHDRCIQRLTVLLLTLCIQPVFYTTFLYGNLPGLCAALWAVSLLVYSLRKRLWLAVWACALLCVAVILKPNYLILAFALTIVLGLYALGAKRLGVLLVALCMLVVPAVSAKGSQFLLEKRTGFELGAGAPQTMWLAMGMQESSRAPGWYNHYPTDTMEAVNNDISKAGDTAKNDIARRAAEFAADPAYALSFYHKKMVSQWSETTFEIGFTNAVMENSSAYPELVNSILTGSIAQQLAHYMEGYTLIVYLAFAAGCLTLVWKIKTGKADWLQLIGLLALMTTIFGGFLYHMLFEAKSQYVLFYVPMMIPIAACGLKQFMGPRS